jgi:hypothetical protein
VSFDLEVWTTRLPILETVLEPLGDWTVTTREATFSGKGWQIVVSAPDAVESDDVPDEVVPSIPGACFVTRLSVEPIGAPSKAMALAQKAARAIASHAHGVVFDPQDGGVTTPSGVTRFVPVKHAERFSILQMEWWFTDGPLLRAAGLDALVDLLAKSLPEAMPRRYGAHEPPQHRLSDTGLDHFRKYLAKHADDHVVWYPSRPVVAVHVGLERRWGVVANGFRCSHVKIGVDASALDQPGWQRGLQDFWRRACGVIRPFYGDVRTLSGFIPARSTYSSDRKTQVEPVQGPWWKGIPRDPGHACVVGAPYLEDWPTFVAKASLVDGLGFVSRDDWRPQHQVIDVVGAVPEAFAQRRTPAWVQSRYGGWTIDWNDEYPERWPFGPRPPRARSIL